MQLTGLTTLLRDSDAYRDLMASLRGGDARLSVSAIRAARSYLLAALAQDWPGPIVYLTARIKRAHNVTEQLPVWLDDPQRPVMRFAEPTAQFYERVPWGDYVVRSRLETLAALMPPDEHANPTQPVVVASVRALMQPTMPVNQFRKSSMLLEPGQRHTLDVLLTQWLTLGYEAAPVVVEPGTFSRRGGVVDIFPVAADHPVRIDFFDDEIDSLRAFDISTQRSIMPLQRAPITPAREALPDDGPRVAAYLHGWFAALDDPEDDMTSAAVDAEPLANGIPFPYLEHYLPYLYPNPVSLLDYAPDGTLFVVEDPDDIVDMANEIAESAEEAREEGMRTGQVAERHPKPFIDWETLAAALAERPTLHLGNATGADTDANVVAGFDRVFTPGPRYGGQLRPMLTQVRDQQADGGRMVIVTQQAPRLTELWYEQDSSDYIPTATNIEDAPSAGSMIFANGTLEEGWTLNRPDGSLHLLTDAEVFGWSRPEPRRRKTGGSARLPEAAYADWKEGDYVVHVDYGIGQFVGMRHRTMEGIEREYLVVQYGGTDTVYVPIHQADRLTRYVGADDNPPTLHRLGQPDWTRVTRKAKKAVEEEARELLELYAARARTSGFAFQPDTHWQHELEASFPYVETHDQIKSVREVKADMERRQPMDRLICGDVGYGKTEVALRAAFKAVMDGKQVAVLVPTTVLAQQHYETFSNRLAPFPVKVEMMSRFRTPEQQRQILPKLATGEIDIIIGTHRILSEDITLKNLGLVIIDEEQRFGVKQKEHFKQLRTQVDVLTLTATPIPRTLYMSLTGVRDISMIQTPPEERVPVITHVGRFDGKLIRQAVLREIDRGGQAFVVHNRIRTIDMIRDKLEDIVPEARIITAHGQMHPRQLESIITRFAHGEFDILLSTSIIENGIDMPNVNTLIVDRADWFGMAQLYQIRGRVGRSAQQAYAYFFHPGSKKVTEDARARLDTLAENTSLGAGLQIAMRDLEIRGAGDILSTRQTGHVAAIGLHLYTQLLTQAIKRLKGEAPSAENTATEGGRIVIELPLPAYLPNDWIPDMALRLQIYRRIAGLTTSEEIEAMRAELRDRFGQLPAAVDGLLYQMEVKALAQATNATHVIANADRVEVRLPYLGEVNRPALGASLGDDVRVSRTAIMLERSDLWQLRLLDVLRAISEGVHEGVGL